MLGFMEELEFKLGLNKDRIKDIQTDTAARAKAWKLPGQARTQYRVP